MLSRQHKERPMTNIERNDINSNEKPNPDLNSVSTQILAAMQSRIQKKAKRGPAKKLDSDSIKAAVELYNSGEYSLKAVGDYFGVSLETIRTYVREYKDKQQRD